MAGFFTPPLVPSAEGVVGGIAWSVKEAALAALTVSGEVVIVLLWFRQNARERSYAYVTVAYETVG